MKTLLRFCLQNRVVVFAMVILISAFGIYNAFKLPIDAVPDTTNVQVQVLTDAPSLGALDIERTITFPIEAALSGMPGAEQVRSISRFGLSAVTIVFRDGTDLLRARQLVGERLAHAQSNLPEGIAPELGPMSTGLGEVLQFELATDRPCDEQSRYKGCHTAMDIRSLLNGFISLELRSVPGVVEINTFGGELKTYEAEINPDRLTAYNLTLADVFSAVENNNLTAGGGSILRSGGQLIVQGEARVRSLDELGSIPLSSRLGSAIRLSDIAKIHFAPMLRQGAVTRDGKGETVIGMAMMLQGANGREVVNAVKEELDRLSASLPEGMSFSVFYDRSELVERTVKTVGKNLAEGALFVVAVLFLLLGTIRGGLIVAAAIPFSMLVAFSGMHMVGLSGNLMSLGAIDFGIVVDTSIIVVENAVVRLVARARGLGRPMTYGEAAEVVLGSTQEVRKAALFGEAIIVMVYLPILALGGIEGRMFKPMAITVLFALLGAFIASLTFVPVLAATFLRHATEEKEPFLVRHLHRIHSNLLALVMSAPKKTFAVSLFLVVVAVAVGSRMGAEFVPRLDEGSIAVQIVRLPGVSLEESLDGSTRFESVMMEFPEVTTVVSKTGRPEIANDPMGVELTDAMVMLKPVREWTTTKSREELVELMSTRLEQDLPDMSFSFSQPIELRTAELISGTRSDVAITVYGEDLAELGRISNEIQGVVGSVEGAEDVRGESLSGSETLKIELDRERAGRYGVSGREMLNAVEMIAGKQIGSVQEGERSYAVQMRLPPTYRNDIEALKSIPIGRSDGSLVSLGEIATLEVIDAPVSVSREGARRKTSVESNVRGRDLASFVSEAQERVDQGVDLPPGYTMKWGGQFENLKSAIDRLAIAVPAALLLIFILLYLAFGRSMPAMLIYLNVPFAAVGGVLLLAVRGMPFSISAAVGFIALFGVSVLNGVVLVSTIERLRKEGHNAFDAARIGSEMRSRAVVMTASVAALGFFPMALSQSAGAEVQRPLATVVIGGMVTSAFLTLFVLPTLYAFVASRSEKLDVFGDKVVV